MKTQKAQSTLLKKPDCFTFGKNKIQLAPISDSTVIIATTVTNIFPR
jgi:hypothetical protein